MISLETHLQAKKALKGLPKEVVAKIESPRPGKKFRFFGPEVQVSILEISVGPELGSTTLHEQAVLRRFGDEGLVSRHVGRGGPRHGQMPLEHKGSNRDPQGLKPDRIFFTSPGEDLGFLQRLQAQ